MHTQGDLLNNYCWSDGMMTVCRLLFAATIALTYPIECFVCREVAENVLCQFGWAQTEQKKKVRSWTEKTLLAAYIFKHQFLLRTFYTLASLLRSPC